MKSILHSHSSKKHIGSIINGILDQQYPTQKDSIPLSELLDWDLWKALINIDIKRKYSIFYK